jgi:hypothetical protein
MDIETDVDRLRVLARKKQDEKLGGAYTVIKFCLGPGDPKNRG